MARVVDARGFGFWDGQFWAWERARGAHMKVLRRKVALEIHRSKIFLWAYPAELINADSTSQTNKAITGWKKSSVAWGAGV